MAESKRLTEEPRAGERIRAIAAELFYRQGIRAVGVDELVSRAHATKPSLYRSFDSKDDLVTAYLRDFADAFWLRFEAAMHAHPGDPRAQLRELFRRTTRRAAHARYRGCGLTNAAVEYPQAQHPAHRVARHTKLEVRRRLRQMAAQLGASDPNLLGDGLTMLLEGAYVSRQVFGSNGPAQSLDRLADKLIDSWPRRARSGASQATLPSTQLPTRALPRGRRKPARRQG
jgi:AcrR family transcriptional regulator